MTLLGRHLSKVFVSLLKMVYYILFLSVKSSFQMGLFVQLKQIESQWCPHPHLHHYHSPQTPWDYKWLKAFKASSYFTDDYAVVCQDNAD